MRGPARSKVQNDKHQNVLNVVRPPTCISRVVNNCERLFVIRYLVRFWDLISAVLTRTSWRYFPIAYWGIPVYGVHFQRINVLRHSYFYRWSKQGSWEWFRFSSSFHGIRDRLFRFRLPDFRIFQVLPHRGILLLYSKESVSGFISLSFQVVYPILPLLIYFFLLLDIILYII
jgi:hypothetical protein